MRVVDSKSVLLNSCNFTSNAAIMGGAVAVSRCGHLLMPATGAVGACHWGRVLSHHLCAILVLVRTTCAPCTWLDGVLHFSS